MKLTVFLHLEGVGAILEQIDSSRTSEGATKMQHTLEYLHSGQDIEAYSYSQATGREGWHKAKLLEKPDSSSSWEDQYAWIQFPGGQIARMFVGHIRAIKEKELKQEPKKLNGTRYVVMTGSAQMPSSCWGHYKRVAVVETDLAEGQPRFIGERAKGLVRIVETWERRNVGKTKRCAYRKALLEAQTLADNLNQKEQHNEES